MSEAPAQPKNPVALLNELRQGLAYVIESQSGPVHAPVFTISVEVIKWGGNGQGDHVQAGLDWGLIGGLVVLINERVHIGWREIDVLEPAERMMNYGETSLMNIYI